MTEERLYQKQAAEKLRTLYEEVLHSWYPFQGQGRKIYSPCIDIAVGPFATGHKKYEKKYNELLAESRNFVEQLISCHNQNIEESEEAVTWENIAYFNPNARCLIGIEIENTGTKKHCIGDLVNASALGRIGLLVAWNQEVLRTFLRQRVYLRYLERVEKNTFKVDNSLILSKEQFERCLENKITKKP